MAAPPVDYYRVLEVDSNATQQQIRDAYKKAALKHHPDRVPSGSPERAARTKTFQQVSDAYYVLSDPARRRDFDSARRFHTFTADSGSAAQDGPPQTPPGGFPWSAFSSAFGFGESDTPDEQASEEFSSQQFGAVFEEMLREEGMAEGEQATPTSKFWSILGGLSGGVMGFIIGNLPGAVAGAVAGNRLGAIRDARGKSVYAVFQELPQADKARLLSDLAGRVFAHAVSS